MEHHSGTVCSNSALDLPPLQVLAVAPTSGTTGMEGPSVVMREEEFGPFRPASSE